MRKHYKHILCLALMLLPIMMRSQALPSLGVAKEITKGTLSNGIAYYLVQNPVDKGFADYSLVRMHSMSIEDERECLDGLPHFEGRKPWRFLADNGVGYSSFGYYHEKGAAGEFRFSGVPVHNQNVADSTLLMLVDIAARSRSPQAVVVCGDINRDKLRERLQLLAMTVPQTDRNVGGSGYRWNPSDSMRFVVTTNHSSEVAAITAIYSSARLERELLDSPQPIVATTYAYLLGNIISGRVRRVFRAQEIPLADISCRYFDSSMSPGDERYSFAVYTSASAANKAADTFARILSDLDRNGALPDEFADAKEQLTSETKRSEGGRQLSNSEYVEKCVASFLYGSNLASESVINGLLAGRRIDPDKELSFFNSFVSALLDGERNLTLRVNVPNSGCDASTMRDTFTEAWNQGSDADYSYTKIFSDTLSLYSPREKVRLRSEITEPITGGKLWTFSNGIKVLYKKTDVRGEFHYSLMLRGGVASVPGIREGESAFVGDMLSLDNVAGLSPYDFKAMLAANGITMDGSVGISDMRIGGIAPKSKLRLLLRSLLSVSEKREPNAGAFRYYKQCEAVRIDMGALSPRDVNSLMDSIMRPQYFYTERKYINRLGDDLPERAEEYFAAQFSKVNDGLLVFMGDLDEESLKKELCRALGSFRTTKRFAQRPVVSSRLASGFVSYTVESGPGLVGGSEIGVNVALAAAVPYNIENYAAFRLAVSCIRKELVKNIAEKGAYVEVSDRLEVFPDERLSVYINCHPCLESGLPGDVDAAVPLDMIAAVRKVTSNLAGLPLSNDDLKAYKEELVSDFEKGLNDPVRSIDAVHIRYGEGKDLVSGYKNAINGVSADKVRSILKMLANGTGVEYVII